MAVATPSPARGAPVGISEGFQCLTLIYYRITLGIGSPDLLYIMLRLSSAPEPWVYNVLRKC